MSEQNAAFEPFDGEAQGSRAENLPDVSAQDFEPAELSGSQNALVEAHSMMSSRETLDFQIKGQGENKLLELSTPILGLCVRIRSMGHYQQVDALHSRLSNEIANFQHEASALGYDDVTTLAARYCLCSMVDESVLSQPWGADSVWPERPMLSIFHNETWGGEKVFGILDRVLDEAHRFSDLLELLYYCLTLGFEGKYHVMHNGRVRLDALIEQVYRILEKNEGEPASKLLNPDVNIYDARQKMGLRIPVWSVLLLSLVLLIGIHLYFDQSLNLRISQISTQIEDTLGLKGQEDVE